MKIIKFVKTIIISGVLFVAGTMLARGGSLVSEDFDDNQYSQGDSQVSMWENWLNKMGYTKSEDKYEPDTDEEVDLMEWHLEYSVQRSDIPRGSTGLPFVNDYNQMDLFYYAEGDYISRQDGREYGIIEDVVYYSSILNGSRNATVILPVNYDTNKAYPVMYLLHGMGGNNHSWINMGAEYVAWNLRNEGLAKDMIIVCTDGFVSYGDESESSDEEVGKAYDALEEDLIKNIMPYVREHYTILEGRENTAVAGYSLGGRAALSLGFKNPELFGYVGAFSPASEVIPNEDYVSVLSTRLEKFEIRDGLDFKLLFICVGNEDEACGDSSRYYEEALTSENIKHIYYEMPGYHDGDVWQNGLYNFIKRIF